MNDYDDLFVDEVMRDCWERKAQLSAEMADWEAYSKRQLEDRPRLEAQGWHYETPEKHAARLSCHASPDTRP
jgi:hypothetical protein